MKHASPCAGQLRKYVGPGVDPVDQNVYIVISVKNIKNPTYDTVRVFCDGDIERWQLREVVNNDPVLVEASK